MTTENDPLISFERIMALYKARLACMAEEQQTTAMFAEELAKIKTKQESIVAELTTHSPTLRLLGLEPPAPQALRAYGNNGRKSVINGVPVDDTKLAFRGFLKKHAGEKMTTADIQLELGEYYGTGTVSGLLTYYGKRGLVKNSSRGSWTISKNIA